MMMVVLLLLVVSAHDCNVLSFDLFYWSSAGAAALFSDWVANGKER